MKKQYCVFSQVIHLQKIILVFLLIGVQYQTQGQLRFSEVSGDSGNNDGTNDGIIELINTSNADFDASCYIISNAEWVVVLPPGTIVAPGEVFLIACSEAQNIGANPNPIPGSGLTCATCDFPNMPIDFDVCNPANSDFVDWAVTGFTIDNQDDTDGDQIVLFEPGGTIIQAVKWGGGATSVFDNTAVQLGTYTLGTPGTGGAGLSSAQLPKALLPGGNCYQMGINFNMPIISDLVYEDLTNSLNPAGKAINATVLQGCNSSFIFDPMTNAWRKTDHPNPGLANDALAYNVSFSAPLTQCTDNLQEITITLEVYNWQAVTPGIVNAKGGVGSFISFDGGATTIPWTNYTRNDATGTTTMTYTFMPSGNATLSVVWDDDKSSALASTPTGSASPASVVNNTTLSDCYEISKHQIIISEPLVSASFTCENGLVVVTSTPANAPGLVYEVLDQTSFTAVGGNIVQSNATGIFQVTTAATENYFIRVTQSSGCGGPVEASGTVCVFIPPCPSNLAYDDCVSENGNYCPGDVLNLSIIGDDLPPGGLIEWVQIANPTDDPYTSGTVIATQNIPVISSISTFLYTQNFDALPNTPEGGGGTCAAQISMDAPTQGNLLDGVSSSVNAQTGILTGDWTLSNTNNNFLADDGTCTTYGAIVSMGAAGNTDRALGGRSSSSTGTQTFILCIQNTTGETITNLDISFLAEQYMAGNQAVATNHITNFALSEDGGGSYTDYNDLDIHSINDGGTGAFQTGLTESQMINGSITGLNIADGATFCLRWTDTDDSGNDHLIGLDDLVISTNSATGMDFVCTDYMIPSEACNSTIYLRPRISPLPDNCSPTGDYTLDALSFHISCPTATLSGSASACAPNTVPLTIDFENYTGTPTFTINYNIDGMAQAPIITTDDPFILNANLSGEYQLTSVTVSDNCIATVNGSALVQVNEIPNISITGSAQICEGLIANIPLNIFAGTLPLTITYTIDGGSPQMVEVFSNQLYIPSIGLNAGSTYQINLTDVQDANGCTGTASGIFALTIEDCCPILVVEAGSTVNICMGKKLNLSDLSASIILDGQAYTGIWSIQEADSDGEFLDANMQLLADNAVFDEAAFFKPGNIDIQRGYITLILTSDAFSAICDQISDRVNIRILKVDCGAFPWNGGN
ncbi:MAG: lamin tail domain-containing protein [Saprospiraceae bacterium]|nr:lamin tail domain-containing protein [Saprospiraceae bacterium]